MKKTISLRAKILALSLGLSSISLLVGGVFFYFLSSLSMKYEHVARINLPNTDLLGNMEAASTRVRAYTRGASLKYTTPERTAEEIAKAEDAIKEFESYQRDYEKVEFVAGEAELYQPVKEGWKQQKESTQKLLALIKENKESNDTLMQKYFFTELPSVTKKLVEALDKLQDFQRMQSSQWADMAGEDAKKSKQIGSILIIISFLLAVTLGIVFSGGLSQKLLEITNSIAQTSEFLGSASSQISSSSEQLSSSATEQSASVQETVASIDQMNAMVSRNAQAAKDSEHISEISYQSAMKGKSVVDSVLQSIRQIDESSQNLVEQINHSNEEIAQTVNIIKEIGAKTRVINDIVFQTKLLSFNASVEAARAGDHGKGFAVVAEEVGKLAQMSGEASKEISDLLENSIRQVESTVESTKNRIGQLIETTKEKVEVGSKTASECTEILEDIVTRVGEVRGKLGDISSASSEQARGVSEVSKAMNQINAAIQQSTSATEQSAASAVELSVQAESLNNMIKDLRVTVTGQMAS